MIKIILNLIICAIGVLLFTYFTPLGLGISPDSVSYLKGAIGLINGYGLNYFSTQWPPFYPLSIALFGSTTSDVMLGARVLNGLIYSINFLLILKLIQKTINTKLIISYLLALLIIIQPPMTYVHFYAWSDSYLLMFVLMDILLISCLINEKYKYITQLSLIVVASLALLTRYAGIVVACTNTVMIFLILQHHTRIKRFAVSIIQIAIPILIFIPWTMHQGISDGLATAREISYHPIPIQTFNRAIAEIGTWFNVRKILPEHFNVYTVQIALGLILLTFILFLSIKFIYKLLSKSKSLINTNENESFIIILAFVVFIETYIAFIIAALSFVDDKVVLDNRILVQIYPLVAICLIWIICKIGSLYLRTILLTILVFLFSTSYTDFKGRLLLSKYGGIEMNSRSFVNSNLQVYIKNCPRNLQVYADIPWNFDLLFSKKVLWTPSKNLYYSGKVNQIYDQEIDKMFSNADLIVIEQKPSDLITQIEKHINFHLIRHENDGVVFVNKKVKTNICDK